jgi:glycosyltransferase involved in cell wall biosynthesis
MAELAPELARVPDLDLRVLVRQPFFPDLREQVVATPSAVATLLRRDPADLYHLTWLHYRCSHYAALAGTPRSVVTVPDLILYLHPEYLPRPARRLYRWLVGLAVRLADRVIVYSAFSRDELGRHLGLSPDRVDVVPLGIDARFRPAADTVSRAAPPGLPAPFILALGKSYPHKGFDTLLAAFARLVAGGRVPHHLVLAGEQRVGPASQPLDQLIAHHRLEGRVHRIDHVPDRDLPGLYASAELFVYPSRYEAFGLPPLEAMASGVPVVAGRAGSLPEVLGPAALFVDPEDAAELAAAIEAVLTAPARHQALCRAGLQQARRFTWADTAARTAAVYRRVLDAPARQPRGRARDRLLLSVGAALDHGLDALRPARGPATSTTAPPIDPAGRR